MAILVQHARLFHLIGPSTTFPASHLRAVPNEIPTPQLLSLGSLLARWAIAAVAVSIALVIAVLALTQLPAVGSVVVISGLVFALVVTGIVLCKPMQMPDPISSQSPAVQPADTESTADAVASDALSETHLLTNPHQSTATDPSEADEELPEPEETDFLLPAGAMQRLTRYQTPDGQQSLLASVRIAATPGEVVHVLHLLFQPPFDELPHVEAELAEGDADLAITLIERFGCRVEVKSRGKQLDDCTLQLVAHTEHSSPDDPAGPDSGPE